MVLVKPSPEPTSDASYLLVDDIGERLCAVWPTVPKPIRQQDSLVELASVCARAAVCTFDEAIERLPTLLDLGILRRNGTIAKKVRSELDRRGARRMNIKDDVQEVPKPRARGGEDGEDEGEEG